MKTVFDLIVLGICTAIIGFVIVAGMAAIIQAIF